MIILVIPYTLMICTMIHIVYRFAAKRVERFLEANPNASRIILYSNGLWHGRCYAGITGIDGRRYFGSFIPKSAPYRLSASVGNEAYILPGRWEVEFGLNLPRFCTSFWLVDVTIEPGKLYNLVFDKDTRKVIIKEMKKNTEQITYARKNSHFRRSWKSSI